MTREFFKMFGAATALVAAGAIGAHAAETEWRQGEPDAAVPGGTAMAMSDSNEESVFAVGTFAVRVPANDPGETNPAREAAATPDEIDRWLVGQDVFAQNDTDRAAVKPAAAVEDDLALLAKKSANPLSDVWMLIIQNDTTVFEGDILDERQVFNSLKFMPVMPFPLDEEGDWNLIVRPVLQMLVSSPVDEGVGDLFGLGQDQIFGDPARLATVRDAFSSRTNGYGDSVLLTLVGPNTVDGLVWGVGATQIFPSATNAVLGQGKWQAGPAGIVARLGTKSGGIGIV